jgi:hypothetical protein
MLTQSRTKSPKLKTNYGMIFILNYLSELKVTLVGLKDYGYLKIVGL